MKILIDPNGVWYHGSPEDFTELRAGSTITQWRALAEAFAHKPSALFYEDDGRIVHNGVQPGFLYEIDEPVQIGTDAQQHPHSTMDAGAEFLIARPLKVKKIADLPAKE